MQVAAERGSMAGRLKKRIQSWHRRREVGFLSRLPVVPDGHLAAIRAAIPLAQPGAVALDLGAGANRKWAHLFEGTRYRYVALDVEDGVPGTAGYVQASADTLPIRTASVDIAVSFEMLEHCREPAMVLTEIARVLKPGGSVILSTRQYWRTHGSPYDFFRYTRGGLEYLFTRAGLQVERITPMGATASVVATAIEQALPALARPLLKQATIYPLWSAARFIDRRYFLRRANFDSDGDTSGWLVIGRKHPRKD